MKKAGKEFSGIILLTPDNKIILQKRDDKLEISNPGRLSFWGG